MAPSVTDTLRELTGAAVARDAVELPPVPGAYLVEITIDRTTTIAAGRLGGKVLPPGIYVYSGSARGPGGIRARVARHLRPAKKTRWHVDHLTGTAASLAAFALPGGCECSLIDRLLASGRFETPLPGFGSSDCRRCASHLLRWRNDQVSRGFIAMSALPLAPVGGCASSASSIGSVPQPGRSGTTT
jgi:Uri superfamily endonuclease